ncbi:MAG: hypothetical protein ACR2L9_03805 [Solirubrobacteraceae bacterium]
MGTVEATEEARAAGDPTAAGGSRVAMEPTAADQPGARVVNRRTDLDPDPAMVVGAGGAEAAARRGAESAARTEAEVAGMAGPEEAPAQALVGAGRIAPAVLEEASPSPRGQMAALVAAEAPAVAAEAPAVVARVRAAIQARVEGQATKPGTEGRRRAASWIP